MMLADPRSMAADQIALELGKLIGRDALLTERAEAGIDAIPRLLACARGLDRSSTLGHACARRRCKHHLAAPGRDSIESLDRQR